MKHIRQLVLAASDLEGLAARLCEALGVEICHRDPGVGRFGLENVLMPVGDTFLEIVAPLPGKAPGATAAGRYMARRGGDTGYMVILQTDDLAGDRARAGTLGVRVVWESRHEDIESMHLHPADVGGAIVSLDEARPPESWRWAGPDWPRHVRTERVERLAGAELESPRPLEMARRWAEVLGLTHALETSATQARIGLEGGELRFRSAPAGTVPGLVGIDIAGPGAAAFEAGGVRFRVGPEFR